MPEIDGIEATRQVLAAAPAGRGRDAGSIVLTSFTDQRRVLDALQAGASGYILKDATPDEVIAAIRAAHAGGAPLDPTAARVLLDAQRAQQPVRNLSPRESEVLGLVAIRSGEQADRAPTGNQRTYGQGAPHGGLPAARRHRPYAGRAVGKEHLPAPAHCVVTLQPSAPWPPEPCLRPWSSTVTGVLAGVVAGVVGVTRRDQSSPLSSLASWFAGSSETVVLVGAAVVVVGVVAGGVVGHCGPGHATLSSFA